MNSSLMQKIFGVKKSGSDMLSPKNTLIDQSIYDKINPKLFWNPVTQKNNNEFTFQDINTLNDNSNLRTSFDPDYNAQNTNNASSSSDFSLSNIAPYVKTGVEAISDFGQMKMYKLGGWFDPVRALGDTLLGAVGMGDVINDRAYATDAGRNMGNIGSRIGQYGTQIAATAIGGPTLGGVVGMGQNLMRSTFNNNLVEKQQDLTNDIEKQNTMNFGRQTPLPFRVGGALYQNNSSLTEYKGNTHEEGGIPIGNNSEVEDGELSYNMGDGGKYIFSNWIGYKSTDDKEKVKGPTFAKEAKEIRDRFSIRPYDAMSKRAEERAIATLTLEQEHVKDLISLMKQKNSDKDEIVNTIKKFRTGGEDPYGMDENKIYISPSGDRYWKGSTEITDPVEKARYSKTNGIIPLSSNHPIFGKNSTPVAAINDKSNIYNYVSNRPIDVNSYSPQEGSALYSIWPSLPEKDKQELIAGSDLYGSVDEAYKNSNLNPNFTPTSNLLFQDLKFKKFGNNEFAPNQQYMNYGNTNTPSELTVNQDYINAGQSAFGTKLKSGEKVFQSDPIQENYNYAAVAPIFGAGFYNLYRGLKGGDPVNNYRFNPEFINSRPAQVLAENAGQSAFGTIKGSLPRSSQSAYLATIGNAYSNVNDKVAQQLAQLKMQENQANAQLSNQAQQMNIQSQINTDNLRQQERDAARSWVSAGLADIGTKIPQVINDKQQNDVQNFMLKNLLRTKDFQFGKDGVEQSKSKEYVDALAKFKKDNPNATSEDIDKFDAEYYKQSNADMYNTMQEFFNLTNATGSSTTGSFVDTKSGVTKKTTKTKTKK